MKIDVRTLVAVAQEFFVRYDAATQTQTRQDLACEAVGMLRAFVRGCEDDEQVDIQRYEAIAHGPDDEEPF